MLGDGLVGQAGALVAEELFVQMWALQGAIIPTVKPVDWFDTKNARLIDHVIRLCFSHKWYRIMYHVP